MPKSPIVPETNPYHNLEAAAARYPNKVAIHDYGGEITYRQLLEEVDTLAGFLQRDLGIAAGDRVLLYMQNSSAVYHRLLRYLRVNGIFDPGFGGGAELSKVECVFRTTIQPRVSDTGGAGHINYTTVPVWFEAGRQEILKMFIRICPLKGGNW